MKIYTGNFANTKKYIEKGLIPISIARFNKWFKDILKRFEQISRGNDIVLLCYEKAGDFCHRRIVADWLEKTLSIEVPEFPLPPPKPKKRGFTAINSFLTTFVR